MKIRFPVALEFRGQCRRAILKWYQADRNLGRITQSTRKKYNHRRANYWAGEAAKWHQAARILMLQHYTKELSR